MIQFQCDYNEGAHPALLQRLVETNKEQTVGYGEDAYCEEARELIRKACGLPEAAVHFLVGGTQTNTTVIAHILRPHQGVIAADTGHINVHETGAIEHTGHKVLALPSADGKLRAQQVKEAIEAHANDSTFEHMVQPGMVYISFPTEVGTLYSRQELEDLYKVCRSYHLPLFIDGARLGYGLCSPACDMSLADLAHYCDIFYIGGTKVGALFGEAVVITQPEWQRDFRYSIKQHGGMLAKGRLLGLQFGALFTDDLYFRIAGNAIRQAIRIKTTLEELNYSFRYESDTNQQFPIFPDHVLEQLNREFLFSFWEKTDETHTAVRICTSWATTEEQTTQLIDALRKIRQ